MAVLLQAPMEIRELLGAVVIGRQALVMPAACAYVAALHLIYKFVYNSGVCLVLPEIVIAASVPPGYLAGPRLVLVLVLLLLHVRVFITVAGRTNGS